MKTPILFEPYHVVFFVDLCFIPPINFLVMTGTCPVQKVDENVDLLPSANIDGTAGRNIFWMMAVDFWIDLMNT